MMTICKSLDGLRISWNNRRISAINPGLLAEAGGDDGGRLRGSFPENFGGGGAGGIHFFPPIPKSTIGQVGLVAMS